MPSIARVRIILSRRHEKSGNTWRSYPSGPAKWIQRTSVTTTVLLWAPPRITVTLTLPGPDAEGICALIWRGETYKSGASRPLTLTRVGLQANCVGHGNVAALHVPLARFVPYISTMEPGAIPARRSAALTTPPGFIAGADGWPGKPPPP